MKITPLHNWIAAKIGVAAGSLNREAIERYQLQRLLATIDLAVTHSPFYRKKLANASKMIKTLADIRELPFTTAEDIKQNPLQFLCVSQDEISRVVTCPEDQTNSCRGDFWSPVNSNDVFQDELNQLITMQTSGTTGKPKRMYFTKEDQELTIDFFCIGMSNLVDTGDRVLILLPSQTSGSVGDLLAKGLERLGTTPIPHGLVQDPEITLRLMRQQHVNALVGIPTQALALARYQEASNEPTIKLKSVLLSTDYLPQAINRQLEQSFGCKVFNHYGMTEMGLGGGVECQALAGYHLREADLYFEIINPRTGKPIPDGGVGEVVFTTLTRRGMPLIRYRTGDWARFIPQPCPCGTVLKRMAQVTGRVQGVYQLAGGPLTLRDLDEALFAIPGVINFTATLSNHNRCDRLTIEYVMLGETNDSLNQIMRSSLNTIPSISQGKLELNLIRLSEPMKISAAKRSIKDLRKE